MSDWMQDNTVSDVQTAIQSQTIQTALEQNTSAMTPQALQSYLTQAPIPRFYYTVNAATFGVGEAPAIFTPAAADLDPLSMVNPTTGLITIPIDGFYTFWFWVFAAKGAAGTAWVLWRLGGGAGGAVVGSHISETASTNCHMTVPLGPRPWRQGDTLHCAIQNASGSTLTGVVTAIGGTWNAPYNNYQGGQN